MIEVASKIQRVIILMLLGKMLIIRVVQLIVLDLPDHLIGGLDHVRVLVLDLLRLAGLSRGLGLFLGALFGLKTVVLIFIDVVHFLEVCHLLRLFNNFASRFLFASFNLKVTVLTCPSIDVH